MDKFFRCQKATEVAEHHQVQATLQAATAVEPVQADFPVGEAQHQAARLARTEFVLRVAILLPLLP